MKMLPKKSSHFQNPQVNMSIVLHNMFHQRLPYETVAVINGGMAPK